MGTNFTVAAKYSCSPPHKVSSVCWSTQFMSLACISTPSLVDYYNDADVEASINSTTSTLTVFNATTEYNGTLTANVRVQDLSTSSRRFECNLKVTVIITGTNEHQSHEWLSRPSNTAINSRGIFLDA